MNALFVILLSSFLVLPILILFTVIYFIRPKARSHRLHHAEKVILSDWGQIEFPGPIHQTRLYNNVHLFLTDQRIFADLWLGKVIDQELLNIPLDSIIKADLQPHWDLKHLLVKYREGQSSRSVLLGHTSIGRLKRWKAEIEKRL